MLKNNIHFFKTSIDFHLFDVASVLYHGNYFILLDRARSQAYQERNYPFKNLWESNLAPAVIEIQSQYLKPITLFSEVLITTEFTNIKGVRINVEQRIFPYEEGMLEKIISLKTFSWDNLPKMYFSAKLKLAMVEVIPKITPALPPQEFTTAIEKKID